MFYYNATHQVVVCQACQSGILPGARSQERHLRGVCPPHGAIPRAARRLLAKRPPWAGPGTGAVAVGQTGNAVVARLAGSAEGLSGTTDSAYETHAWCWAILRSDMPTNR